MDAFKVNYLCVQPSKNPILRYVAGWLVEVKAVLTISCSPTLITAMFQYCAKVQIVQISETASVIISDVYFLININQYEYHSEQAGQISVWESSLAQ